MKTAHIEAAALTYTCLLTIKRKDHLLEILLFFVYHMLTVLFFCFIIINPTCKVTSLDPQSKLPLSSWPPSHPCLILMGRYVDQNKPCTWSRKHLAVVFSSSWELNDLTGDKYNIFIFLFPSLLLAMIFYFNVIFQQIQYLIIYPFLFYCKVKGKDTVKVLQDVER